MLVGNSFAENQAGLVLDSFKQHYANFTVFSLAGKVFHLWFNETVWISACEVFSKTNRPWCAGALDRFRDAVAEARPDVLFLMQRLLFGVVLIVDE